MSALKFISFSVLVFFGSGKTTLAQKIKGIYFGELISEKNTLVLSSSESELTGVCYLNKTDKLDFSGAFVDKLLKGTIRLEDGSDVTLEGHLEDGILKLSYRMHNEQRSTSLVKFSSSDRYDPDEVYSERHDPLLVGKWHYVKTVYMNGDTTSNGKTLVEFETNGRETTQVIKAKSTHANLPGLTQMKAESTWYTDGTVLSTSLRTPRGNMVASFTYLVKRDTLIKYGTKAFTVYARGDY